jgi:rRNA maturation protein Nop10
MSFPNPREHRWTARTAVLSVVLGVLAIGGLGSSAAYASANDAYFVKTQKTASGTIEAFTATAASGYTTGISSRTRFSAADANNGTFGLLPNNDLYFVKTNNTASGTIEAFTATAASGYTTGNSSPTRFSAADANNGTFGLLPNNDLYFVKTKNTASGTIEAFTATAASGYRTGTSSPTRFSAADANNGFFGLLG